MERDLLDRLALTLAESRKLIGCNVCYEHDDVLPDETAVKKVAQEQASVV